MKAMVILYSRRSGKVVARTEDARFTTFELLAPYEIGYGDIISHRDFLQVGIQRYRNATNRQAMVVNVHNIGTTIGEIEEQGFLLRLISRWWEKRRNSANRPVAQDKSS
jgi:hypothetical protein